MLQKEWNEVNRMIEVRLNQYHRKNHTITIDDLKSPLPQSYTDSYTMDRFSKDTPARRGCLWSTIEDEVLQKELNSCISQLAISHRRTRWGIISRIRHKNLIKVLTGEAKREPDDETF